MTTWASKGFYNWMKTAVTWFIGPLRRDIS
jgi:hypothetical protein